MFSNTSVRSVLQVAYAMEKECLTCCHDAVCDDQWPCQAKRGVQVAAELGCTCAELWQPVIEDLRRLSKLSAAYRVTSPVFKLTKKIRKVNRHMKRPRDDTNGEGNGSTAIMNVQEDYKPRHILITGRASTNLEFLQFCTRILDCL